MARNAFCLALCLTFAVTSAAEDAKGLAADASTIFSGLAKSQLGLDNMKSTIDSFKFEAATMDGKKFVEQIAKQTTDKLKKRMQEAVTYVLFSIPFKCKHFFILLKYLMLK